MRKDRERIRELEAQLASSASDQASTCSVSQVSCSQSAHISEQARTLLAGSHNCVGFLLKADVARPMVPASCRENVSSHVQSIQRATLCPMTWVGLGLSNCFLQILKVDFEVGQDPHVKC